VTNGPDSKDLNVLLGLFLLAAIGVSLFVAATMRVEPKEAVVPLGPVPGGTQPAQQKVVAQQPVADSSDDEWVSAVGRIDAGVTVYFRNDKNSEPEPWFTVINPFVEGEDGEGPFMLVRYAVSGRQEYLPRRDIMRSPAAHAGQLVIRR
jgi:hypothetical protein